jgi:hypothetical protein
MNAATEAKLWSAVKRGARPRDVIRAMMESGEIQVYKQAERTLEKWCDQGCYDYGVCLDLGWADHGGKVPVARHDAASQMAVPT